MNVLSLPFYVPKLDVVNLVIAILSYNLKKKRPRKIYITRANEEEKNEQKEAFVRQWDKTEQASKQLKENI